MRLIRGYWKTAVVGIGILYASLTRGSEISLPDIAGADKWVHIAMYTVLAGMLAWDSWQQQMSGWRWWLIAAAIPMVYGGVIELVQEAWFAPRSGEWLDWLADCIGAVVGTVCIVIISTLYKTKNAK